MFDSKKSKVAYCQALHLSPAQEPRKGEKDLMKLETVPIEVEDSQSQALIKINSYQMGSHNESGVQGSNIN